jgi:hypothetical protein
VPNLRFHIRELVQDHTIQIWTAQRVRIVSPVETNHRAIDEVDTQVGFIGGLCQQRLCITPQIAPRRVFGLIALWEDKGVAALILTLVDCATDEIVQRGDRLASAPMADRADQRRFREWNGLNWSRGLYLIFTRF